MQTRAYTWHMNNEKCVTLTANTNKYILFEGTP